MKVITSLYQIYQEIHPIHEMLQKIVDRIISGRIKNQLHYESRIKEIESYALKMETGRVTDPKKMEDFFACMIVVENHRAIDNALETLEEKFHIESQRPESRKFTNKDPSSFLFDDLRIYVRLKEDKSVPPFGLESIIFEIQIKTYLQYAWYIATHDLIYKSADISWSKDRIAYQIKAILENAELSIGSLDTLSDSPEILKHNVEYDDWISCKDFIEEMWDKDDLPEDMSRLSKNTAALLKALQISLEDLKEIIKKETSIGRGTLIKNLSPFLVILKSIYIYDPKIITRYRKHQDKKPFQLYIPKELEIDNNTL